MNNTVVIKGFQSGLIIVLDDKPEYSILRNDIIDKFSSSSAFLGKADVAVTFEGRELTNEQMQDIIGIIHDNTNLNVVCVLSDDPIKEAHFQDCIEEKLLELSHNTATYYKGSIRSGQKLDFGAGIIILGDVNQGASVTARGNIIVIGSLFGSVTAGSNKNNKAFVVALDMKPEKISVGEYTYLPPASKSRKLNITSKKKQPEIAYVDLGEIKLREITKEVIHELRIQ